MQSRTTQTKRERLEARITAEQKALLQRAADLEGRSVTSFVVEHLMEAAEETVRKHERIGLSPEETMRFVAALLDPSEPAPALREAARRYRAFVDAE